MTLSFIIPVYNTEVYLVKCVESIISQIDDLCEIIMVNDGSTDDSLHVMQALAQKHNCIKIIDQANCGLGASRNAGIKIAEGKYIFFLDSDDYVLPNSLKQLLKEAESSDCDILGVDGEMIFPDEHSEPMKKDQSLYNKIMVGAEYIATHNLDAGSWYVYSREFLKKYDLWMPEGIVHEDELFDSKGFTLAQKVEFLPISAYGYLRRDSSITRKHNKRFVQKKAKDRAEVVRELLAFQKTERLTDIQRKGLKRKIDFLAVDLIVNLIRFKSADDVIYPAVREFREMGLFPLSKADYSLKYKLFRTFFTSEKRIHLAIRLGIKF